MLLYSIFKERCTYMIELNIKNEDLVFESNENVFSPKGIDTGTLSMLSEVEFHNDDKVLDLGCGYGVVGILAAKKVGEDNVTMVDINEDAVKQSKINAKLNKVDNVHILKSNGVEDVKTDNFSLILSNPPYHEDFKVPKEFIEKGFKKLKLGGKMYMVTKRKEWYKRKLISVFGGVKIKEIEGYYVFMAEKQIKAKSKDKHLSSSKSSAKNMSKKLSKKLNKWQK